MNLRTKKRQYRRAERKERTRNRRRTNDRHDWSIWRVRWQRAAAIVTVCGGIAGHIARARQWPKP